MAAETLVFRVGLNGFGGRVEGSYLFACHLRSSSTPSICSGAKQTLDLLVLGNPDETSSRAIIQAKVSCLLPATNT